MVERRIYTRSQRSHSPGKNRCKENLCVSIFTRAELTEVQGVKLRELFEASQTAPLSQVSWATTLHPNSIIQLGTCLPLRLGRRGLRMHYFECNAPGTTGYSVATDGSKVYTIYAHQGSNLLPFYKDPSFGHRSLHWIYMPTDRGEYLVEICRQYGTHLSDEIYLSIMVRSQRLCLQPY